jgi:hypothetical protein
MCSQNRFLDCVGVIELTSSVEAVLRAPFATMPSQSPIPHEEVTSTDLPFSIMQLDDRNAARQVFDLIGIRQCIFDLLDRGTLGRLMQLEKGAMQSVADLLYKKVHVSHLENMNRSSVS